MGRRSRCVYRILRHPLVLLVLFPPMVFLVLYRTAYDAPLGWGRERRSVHLTILSLLTPMVVSPSCSGPGRWQPA